MHPQHMQSSSVLHLPLVTAMTGQVKVSVVNFVLRHTKFGHGGLQDVQGYIKVRMSLREVAHSYCLQQKRMHQKEQRIPLGKQYFQK